jgi:hypothetical protein
MRAFLTRILRSIPHLSNEDPDQPETEREKNHETVTDKFKEAIRLLLNDIDDHFTSFEKI